MHQPHAEPRRSIYYDYQVFDAWLPSQHPQPQRHAVVIAGAGPIGLVADAHRGPGLAIAVDLPRDVMAAIPAEVLEAVLETLVENSRQAGAERVEIAGTIARDDLVLTVTDDGPGIPPADRERIFEPFHTGRRAEGGSGLGLAIARSLLAACGGTIASEAWENGARIVLRVGIVK